MLDRKVLWRLSGGSVSCPPECPHRYPMRGSTAMDGGFGSIICCQRQAWCSKPTVPSNIATGRMPMRSSAKKRPESTGSVGPGSPSPDIIGQTRFPDPGSFRSWPPTQPNTAPDRCRHAGRSSILIAEVGALRRTVVPERQTAARAEEVGDSLHTSHIRAKLSRAKPVDPRHKEAQRAPRNKPQHARKKSATPCTPVTLGPS